MEKQQNFTDIEYTNRRRTTKSIEIIRSIAREELLSGTMATIWPGHTKKEIEKRKSSVRCKVEYVFHIVKDIFCWRKTRYKGIHKNDCHAHLLFASANLYMLAMG